MKKLFFTILCILLILPFQQNNAQNKKQKRKHNAEQQATTQKQQVEPTLLLPPETLFPAFTTGMADTIALTTKATITANTEQAATTPADSAELTEFTEEELQQRLAYFYTGNWKNLKTKAEQEKKAFMVDFYTDWCRVCKQMDREIFAQDQTIQLFNRYFLAYKLNAEKSEKAIADSYGVTAYPTFIFFDYKGNELGRITGYFAKNNFLQQLNQYKPNTPNTRYTKFR